MIVSLHLREKETMPVIGFARKTEGCGIKTKISLHKIRWSIYPNWTNIYDLFKKGGHIKEM